MGIIGKVIWSPETPRAGDSVRIDVCGPDGKPYDNKQGTYIGINGVAGSAQYVQFPFACKQKLVVNALGPDGEPEQSTVELTIAAPQNSEATQRRLADPANKAWTSDQIAWVKAVSDIRVLTSATAPPYNNPRQLTLKLVPLSAFVPPAAVKSTPLPTQIRPAPGAELVSLPAEADSYQWDFGDGSPVAKTTGPAVTHDFSSALGITDEFHQFHLTVTALNRSAAIGTWTRTVSVHNPYVSCKKQGNLVLAVKAKGWAVITKAHIAAIAEISNPEPVAITLGRRVLLPIGAGDETLPPGASEAIDPPITVPANGTVTVHVSAARSNLPAEAEGFAAVFTEKAVVTDGPLASLKIRATGYFRLAPRPAERTDDKKETRPEDKTAFAVGDPCDPDNLPENIPTGFVCQVTKDTATVGVPAQFLNARKGDVILCPSVGSASLVDGIFTQLTPEQLYGHSGIMTSNYTQITHCTASQDRMVAYGQGFEDSAGMDPDVIKYGWPGTMTETVDHAVNGYSYPDPAANGTLYQFQSFNSSYSALPCGDGLNLIPPLVVKPDPALETAAVRKTLCEVADDAAANTGKFHYRFYVFSDAAHAPPAPAANGLDAPSTWAANTAAGVCSAFIWKMMKGRGVHAVGASQFTTQSELSYYATHTLGLKVAPDGTTEDGLFYYDQDDRLKCGSWLWNQVYNMAAEQAGWFGEFLTGAAGKYANQLCNTFAADDAQLASALPIGQPWQTPGGGSAISPHNFLAWIGPEKGGLLGYSEPLSFEPATIATVPVYKWAKVSEYGKVTGKVTRGGKPAEHVTVTLPGLEAGTDKDGVYTFDKVPFGPCLIKAMLATEAPTGATVDSMGEVRLDVDTPSQDAPEIKLSRPDDPLIRTLVVSGHCSLDCSEWDWFSNGHTTNWYELAGQVDLAPYSDSAPWQQLETSKDASAVLSATLQLKPDNSVDVVFTAALDQPGGRSLSFASNIEAGKSHTFIIGDKNSWLNGTGPEKWTYDGVPDLEAKNDTLCCAVTFTNNEWVG